MPLVMGCQVCLAGDQNPSLHWGALDRGPLLGPVTCLRVAC